MKKTDIEEWKQSGGLLLDVRSREEYETGHIEESLSVPLSAIKKFQAPLDTPLYVYCATGSRAGLACRILKAKGFRFVKNIGGIREGLV
ncbi:rhodanese-like domain-containing protein [Catenisphaera adipataccumulans]|jgi:phage shock protein E|uniref:Rhodanese-related sulfurtransferase n=1 Tax=Catenisphaera adipataccumulans TaxID=700500 RepID=A0A7W8FWB6_9FIRM|nr:rhodanese-like domain-containing protein [Catenisphaera adipataccumulans]MBB5183086.1 rhodanese-related sulfurtransferase [Catenisphaera adipataccumulans]